ncbi:MAG: hypothetical protein NTZ93_00420 [Candidatus Beckwithbacteria bacterium]|nr:hypothetical protein [Candidatus Beckwithbacteria bacterium]
MEKFDDQLYGDKQFKFRPKKIYFAYARAIWEIFKPKELIDFGCANGYSLEWWQKKGIRISGVEAARAAFKYMPRTIKPYVKKLDLRNKLNLGQAEVVNFTEVAEHIDKKYEATVLNNVIGSVKDYLIISWSNEVNPEHVNPRSLKYIKRQINLFFEPELTQALKNKLKSAKIYQHWHKNVLVFSRIPPRQRILVRHYEWHPTYANKNIGYFMAAAEKSGYSVRKVIDRNEWGSLFKCWHRVWLYPFEKHLLLKLLILKLFDNKVIIKMDSVIVPTWRAKLIVWLCQYVLVESTAVAKPFGKNKKLIWYSGGLSQENIDLIKKLKINREKIILYAGRLSRQKGVDRLKTIIPSGWKLKIAHNLKPKAYYKQVLKSSLMVLPTRGEGWPNVFSDAWFCRRLFLTTTKARCAEGILNQDFYSDNLKSSVKKITQNLEWYYRNYDRLYDARKFVVTDKAFLSLITNQG